MKLKDVLTKLLNGETLTDEEKTFCEKYDEQKLLDAAAGAARKKAEQERDGFKTKVDELQAALDEANKSGKSSNDVIVKLQKDVADLMKANKESTEKLAAQARSEAIRKAVGEAKIICAKGVSSTLFDNAINAAFTGVDMDNAEVVKTTLETFKKDNPALIGAEGVGGTGTQGKPGNGTVYDGPNPFSAKTRNLTKCIELSKSNPELAKSLQEEAAKETA